MRAIDVLRPVGEVRVLASDAPSWLDRLFREAPTIDRERVMQLMDDLVAAALAGEVERERHVRRDLLAIFDVLAADVASLARPTDPLDAAAAERGSLPDDADIGAAVTGVGTVVPSAASPATPALEGPPA